ncbi:MAG: hypothetical protein HFI64_08630 [Lachnospiraceae bacterium]|nr:hypothetical protein [Lachnospiraceae bacterium]
MAWTIKLAFVVLLTSLTGSIVLLVWHFIGKGLEWLGYGGGWLRSRKADS